MPVGSRRSAWKQLIIDYMGGIVTKKAFITGITGQDGSYLAELLLSKGYEVHGLIRRASTFNTSRIDHFYVDSHNPDSKLFLHYGDLSDGTRLVSLLAGIKPDEVCNLGAQSRMRVSLDESEHTGDTIGVGSMRLFEAVRMAGINTRFYQASSSEMFGANPPPQNEDTPFYPRSPTAPPRCRPTGSPRTIARHTAVCRQRHPVQPRVATPWTDVRNAQDYPRRRRDQGWPTGRFVAGQS